MSRIDPTLFTDDLQRLRTVRTRFATTAVVAVLSAVACGGSLAACPSGDPTVIYCDDFAGTHPLANYFSIDSSPPWTISVVDEALTFSASSGEFRYTWVLSSYEKDYRDTLLEADVRFDTGDAGLRSAIALTWANAALDARLQVALQLDEQTFSIYTQSGAQSTSRALKLENGVESSKTYRLGLAIDEVPGATSGRPTVLRFKGYIDGELILSETEETLGVDLSALPPLLSPGFHGASHITSPIVQVMDNAIARKSMTLACNGFEAPLDQGPVAVAKNRTLPAKMTLTDAQGVPVTNLGSVPPLVKVIYTPTAGAPSDVTGLAVAVGQGTAAKQFVYGDGKWQFNLKTKAFTSPGSYTVTAVSGGGYTIDPGCTVTFVVK